MDFERAVLNKLGFVSETVRVHAGRTETLYTRPERNAPSFDVVVTEENLNIVSYVGGSGGIAGPGCERFIRRPAIREEVGTTGYDRSGRKVCYRPQAPNRIDRVRRFFWKLDNFIHF